MKHKRNIIGITVAMMLTGCATGPDTETLTQLDKEGVLEMLSDNTLTLKASYGKWSEYYDSYVVNSIGQASGSWGSEIAQGTNEISDEGEICVTYEGDYEWSTPENQYCNLMYIDPEGTYFSKVTQNTTKPDRIGQIRKVTMKSGDHYNLSKKLQ